MACPFFLPTERFAEGGWPHRARLPLGDGWRGFCTALGHQACQPADDELKEFCNLGYAKNCKRLPEYRAADAVRFGVTCDRGNSIEICFVCEIEHRPGEHGILQYDVVSQIWRTVHDDARVQKMAACYLESYLLRKRTSALARQPSS